MPWCKLHTDILGDAKLLRAARKGARHLVVLPWLFAWAKAHDPEDAGRLLLDGEPVEPEDIAAQLPGVRAADVAACMAALQAVGVLEPDGAALRFAAWPVRSGAQSQKPSDHPDQVLKRVHRHRMKRRGVTPASGVTDSETPGVTPECNDLKRVTGVSSVTQKEKEKESETERETENNSNSVPAAVASGRRAVSARRRAPRVAPPELALAPDTPRPPEPWYALYEDWVGRKGHVEVSHFRKFIGPLFQPNGARPGYEPRVLHLALQWAVVTEEKRGRLQFLTPQAFAADVVTWAKFAGLDSQEARMARSDRLCDRRGATTAGAA